MTRISGLPLFPLGLVLYPGERLPLHIFEPRYKELVAYCVEHDAPFGIILATDDGAQEVGCTARVDEIVQQYEDGRMDIIVNGEERFRVIEFLEGAAYLRANAEVIPEPKQPLDTDLRERAITQHMKLLELAGRTMRPSLYEGVTRISYVLAQNAGMKVDQKQAVLELPTENERISYLIAHFESLIPRVEEMESLRRKIQSNGHFKDFPPEWNL